MAKSSETYYRLDVDTLGYRGDDGVREELTGRGTTYKASDLHENAIARGEETNALVKVAKKDVVADHGPQGGRANPPDFDKMTDEELLTSYATISPQTDRSEVEALLKTNREEVVAYVRDNYDAHP